MNRIVETKERFARILTKSGYLVDDGKNSIRVIYTNNANHMVFYGGQAVGMYNYETERLKFLDDRKLELWSKTPEDVILERGPNGFWVPTQETWDAACAGNWGYYTRSRTWGYKCIDTNKNT